MHTILRYFSLYLRHILFIAVLSLAATIHAATEFTVEQLTTIDGLANNTVRYITQDSKGRMWFATSNGVSIYDGQTLTTYRPSRLPHGLPDQRVTFLAEDASGHMWIDTKGGLCCFDLRKDCFMDYAASGLKMPAQASDKTSSPNTRNRQKSTDADGRLWSVSATDGLFVTGADGQTEHFTTKSENCPLPTNTLKCIFIDNDGILWIGTDNLGVSRIVMTKNKGAKYMLEGENIRMLTLSGDGRVAAANKDGDLWMYDEQFRHLITHESQSHNTYCIATDAASRLWQGTKGGGLLMNHQHVDDICHKEIYSLLLTPENNVWIGTFGDGLIGYDPVRKQITHHLLTASYESRRIRQLALDTNRQLWVATSDGVYVFSNLLSTPRTLQPSMHLCVANGSLRSNEVRTLFIDSKERVYIAEAGKGFALWNHGHTTHYSTTDGLVNDMVQCFVEDQQGFMWIATELGISRFDPQSRKFQNYFFSKNMLSNVFNENSGTLLPDGRIALGSDNGILIITPSVYNSDNGTPTVNADDITVGGQPIHHDTHYIITSLWQSPWTWTIIALSVLGTIVTLWFVRRRHVRMCNDIHVLCSQRNELADRTRQLTLENHELTTQKQALSEECDRFSSDIVIKRNELQTAEMQAFINQLEQIADSQIDNPDFSADDFAAQIGMGRTVFFKKMKTLTGYTPANYLRLRRLHKAAHLISTTSLTIAEIATHVGINDALYFSRIFKAEFKCSPTEWRNKTKENKGTPEQTCG